MPPDLPPQPGHPAPGATPGPSMATPPQQPPGGGGAPPQPGARPGMHPGIPPQFQRFVDPNNPVQAQLLQRFDRLSPAAVNILRQVFMRVPQAALIFKQLLPEIGFIFDMLVKPPQQQGAPQQPGQPQPPRPPGPPGAPPQGGPPQAGAPAAPSPNGAPRPGTRLGAM